MAIKLMNDKRSLDREPKKIKQKPTKTPFIFDEIG